jgi:CRISPR-associated endonuclease/helicase Cas3
LTVPTGGKTLPSLTFALDPGVRHGLGRVIYVIPFASIIEQTAGVFHGALGRELAGHVIEHHSAFREDEVIRALEKAAIAGDKSSFQSGARLRLATEDWDAPSWSPRRHSSSRVCSPTARANAASCTTSLTASSSWMKRRPFP